MSLKSGVCFSKLDDGLEGCAFFEEKAEFCIDLYIFNIIKINTPERVMNEDPHDVLMGIPLLNTVVCFD